MVRRLVLVGYVILASSQCLGQSASDCGEPPPVANEALRGEIRGQAQFLSRFLGDASLAGHVETSREEIFSKYPDAEKSRSNAYFEYQVCILIMSDTKMTTREKLDVLQEIRNLIKQSSIPHFLIPSTIKFPGSGSQGCIGPYCGDNIVELKSERHATVGYAQFELADQTYLGGLIVEYFSINVTGFLADRRGQVWLRFAGADLRPHSTRTAEAGGIHIKTTIDHVRTVSFLNKPMFHKNSLKVTLELSPISHGAL